MSTPNAASAGVSTAVERQKRATIEAKETYYRGKRDLLDAAAPDVSTAV